MKEPVTPMSFGSRCMVTCTLSLNTVAHGLVVEHGAGDVTSRWTSENSVVAPDWAEVLPPGCANSESTTIRTGARLSRVTSPQDAAAIAAASTKIRRAVRIPVIPYSIQLLTIF